MASRAGSNHGVQQTVCAASWLLWQPVPLPLGVENQSTRPPDSEDLRVTGVHDAVKVQNDQVAVMPSAT